MKKKMITVLAVLGISAMAHAQNGIAAEWGAAVTSSGAGNMALGLAADQNGNVISTGYLSGTCDLDPGSGMISYASASEDIMIMKQDASGNLLWSIPIGGASADRGNNVATDNNGNIYIAGRFMATVDFDPGTGTANRTASNTLGAEAFLLKLDPNGNFLWVNHLASVTGSSVSSALDVQVDSNGDVVISGSFQGTIDADPSAGTAALIATGVNDAFIAKYTAAGNHLWSKAIGSTGNDYAYSISIDQDTVYCTGRFSNTMTIGTDNLTSAGGYDIFLSKFDPNGNSVWNKSIGGTGDENCFDVLAIPGFVMIVGTYENTVDFNLGAGGSWSLSSAGGKDGFFALYESVATSTGGAARFTGPADVTPYAISGDADGFYVAGYSAGSVALDPFTESDVQTVSGSTDMFITFFDPGFAYIWGKTIGGTNWDAATDVLADPMSAGAYTAGYIIDQADLDDCNSGTILDAGNSGIKAASVLKHRPAVNASTPSVTTTQMVACQGDTVSLSISAGNLNDASDWFWYVDGCGTTAIGNGSSVDYVATQSGSLTIYARGEGACVSPSNCGVSIPIAINESPAASFAVTDETGNCDGAIDLTASNGSAPYTFSWSSGATTEDISGLCQDTYCVTITDMSGCSVDTCVDVLSVAGIEDVEVQAVTIYPNPAKEKITINHNFDQFGVSIYDLNGKLILSDDQSSDTIDVSFLERGVYIVELHSEGQRWQQRLIIE